MLFSLFKPLHFLCLLYCREARAILRRFLALLSLFLHMRMVCTFAAELRLAFLNMVLLFSRPTMD